MRRGTSNVLARGLWANPLARAGTLIVLFFITVAILAPVLTPYEPLRSAGPALQPPQAGYWFGTDDLGRDIYTQVLYGLRVSLLVGFSAAAIALIIGVLMGSVAGYRGGHTDDV